MTASREKVEVGEILSVAETLGGSSRSRSGRRWSGAAHGGPHGYDRVLDVRRR
ncbi:basic proline-rich protein-like [Iris pallida]|uniref:Basic proline-rich protein-like n=1 Tax=Iris pallida TaxID=29817 RepID=A0AAX6H463_IRIPA|nr:basic proline-rich protein-like [Iris pallida]